MLEQSTLVDNGSDIEEFDPTQCSTPSSSSSDCSIHNEIHNETLETTINTDKRSSSNERNNSTQTDFSQLTCDITEEVGDNEIEESDTRDKIYEGGIEQSSEDQYQREDFEEKTSSDVRRMSTYSGEINQSKSTNDCKRMKLTLEHDKLEFSANRIELNDEAEWNLNLIFNNQQILSSEYEYSALETAVVTDPARGVFTAFSNADETATTETHIEKTDAGSESSPIKPATVFVTVAEVPIGLLKNTTDNTERLPVEIQMAKTNQYFESLDEDLITNTDSTNIAAIVEVITEQPSTKKKKKKQKRIFPQRAEGFYPTRSRK
ncbi:unnamed protein product [Adineta ricciae]|uniref:Uncharacterized protein n=2 Tax=Adineta ricciae TaxID=249248 RepID=A0A815WYI1_ADIRI|nr:unnamed protein product [Adineta ricciae]